MSYPVYSTGFPYTAVVYLEATFADGTLSGGTGVVVGQNDILTASHVVFNAGRGGRQSRLPLIRGVMADRNLLAGLTPPRSTTWTVINFQIHF